MENNPIQTGTPVKKSASPAIAGILSLVFAVISIPFHNAAGLVLAIIIGVYGVIKGDKLGKILSVLGIVIGIIGFLLFNPFQSSSQSVTQSASPTTNSSVYSNSTYNFQITPPASWLTNSSPQNGIVAFADPNSPQSDHPAIIVQILPGNNLNLDDFVNSAITQSKNAPGFSLINQQKLGSGTNSYYLIEDNMSSNTTGSVHSLMLIKQASNGQYFLLSGESADGVWSTYASTIKNSLLSFTN